MLEALRAKQVQNVVFEITATLDHKNTKLGASKDALFGVYCSIASNTEVCLYNLS